ncbi:conserved Plasmodium protein, unknown function [Plasmodium relictum]|uniref:Uncharacterized protein n=1 Tax=Plasmodium relictum TaxID=85471 RepID=A0A1J1HF47_PLARL|nr:conserved Plasmodium protein, unknown function [Plasmodium relictum]CRH02682.1 conserved Plasmodium protein, unknown function [Plasmodium relictum]
MKFINFSFIFNKRNFSKYNFFISIRKGGESILKNDIKYIYVKDLIKYEKQRNNINKEKKVKHLIKLTKTNGGIQLKCSLSLIYLLSLKCRYAESIWLNLAKNKMCNSLNCLENIILNIDWNKVLNCSDLINIPLKIICINSKLFDTKSIKNTIYKCLNIIIDRCKNITQDLNDSATDIKSLNNKNINVNKFSNNSTDTTTLNSYSEYKNKLREDNMNMKKLNNNEKTEMGVHDNLYNVWNLLAVHIENNICNVDIKFTGKLSPRFYEYGYIKELENVKNIEKYQNLNFFSLFNNNHKINDEKIKNIVNENVPFWSICEEKKKIQNDHQNVELNTEKNHYKYNFFSNTLGKRVSDWAFDNTTLLLSQIKKKELKNYETYSEENKQQYSIFNEEKKRENEKSMNYILENENMQLNNYISNEIPMNKFKEENVFLEISHNSINKFPIKNREEKEQCEKINRPYIETKEIDKNNVVNYLKNMEIKRMNYYNNNFFLSDDCYDSSSCIYSLVISKCLKNKKKINIIWDPFCSNGNLIFELLNYFLNFPLYNEKEILPFMNLKIFNKEEFLNIYNYALNDLNNNYSNMHLIGSDNRSIMIAQCKKNLVRYSLYYAGILRKIKLENNKKKEPKNFIYSNEIKKNSFLKNVLKENIKEDEDEEEIEYDEEIFYDDKLDINFVKDLDQLYNIEKDNKKKEILDKKKKTKMKNEEKKKEIEMKNEELKVKIPDIETISISTEEDKKYNLNFPFDISFHKAHFFNVAPFIKNAMIITKIPHFNFSKELGISKKTLTLYEQFDQMLCSKNDWLGVYVLIRNKVFLNKSKLEWNKILSINDSKGRQLTLLSWSGRKKSLYSLSAENDRLKELERFSEKLKFGI